jgi:hypothetical protein
MVWLDHLDLGGANLPFQKSLLQARKFLFVLDTGDGNSMAKLRAWQGIIKTA